MIVRRRARSRLHVLSWHNVDPTWCFPFAPGRGHRGLARQLEFCRRFATVVSLDDGVRALTEGRPLPPRAVALTFDDGYRDNVTDAVPLLERLGLPATFFLVPELLSGAADPWWEVIAWTFHRARVESVTFEGRSLSLRTPAERRRAGGSSAELLKRRSAAQRAAALEELRERCRPDGRPPGRDLFLDWDDAKELARRGFAVGSHSMSHHILAMEDAESQRADLFRSRRELEEGLQLPVRYLAYPNGKAGDYDAATLSAADRAGYVGSFTTQGGHNTSATPRHQLRRFVVDPDRGLAAFGLLPRQLLHRKRPVMRDGHPWPRTRR